MGTNEIQELFDKHTVELTYTDNTMRVMNEDAFTNAINQAELEWYKELDKQLDDLTDYDSVRRILDAINRYQAEIQNKIKELEPNDVQI